MLVTNIGIELKVLEPLLPREFKVKDKRSIMNLFKQFYFLI